MRDVVHGWESDNSQFHLRRRACTAACRDLPDRLAVLLVEQDPKVVQQLSEILVGQPVEIRSCADPATALLEVGRTCPDVVLLGPATGRLDAIDFLDIVRRHEPDLPVVAGAGAGAGEFAAKAAEIGVTAIVPRPYRPQELLRLLRSFAPRPENVDLRPIVLDLGRLRIDGTIPQFWLDGELVSLPPMEFLLLRYFAERVGAVLTRKDLISAVWGEHSRARSNTLTVHIMRLRKRLGDDDQNPQWIRAVRGLGYQFTVPLPGAIVPVQEGSAADSPGVHQV